VPDLHGADDARAPKPTPSGDAMAIYSTSRARRSLLDTAFFKAISQLATFAGYAVMVRGMTEHNFGILSLLYSMISLATSFASLGLEQTLIRYQPEYLKSGQPAAAAWLLRLTLRLRLASNVVLLGLTLLAWQWFAPFFHLAPYRLQFVLFGAVLLLHFQTQLLQISLASHMQHRYSVGLVALVAVAKLVIYLGVTHWSELTLQNAILSDIAAYGISYLGLRVAHHIHCRSPAGSPGFRPVASERRRLLRYGVFNNFNELGSFLISSQSDNFFIAAMVNPVAVGAYSFYTRLMAMSMRLLPLQMFDNVIRPMFFSTLAVEAVERIPRYFTFLINTSLVLLLPMVVYSLAYHHEIVATVFDGKFISQSYLLPVVFAFQTFNIVAVPVTLVAQYEEKARTILTSKVFIIYSIAAMVMLLPTLGLLGAALATGTGEALKNGFIWWHVRRLARWTNFASVLIRTLIVWGCALGACLLLKKALPAPGIVHLAIGALICGGAVPVFIRSGALSPSDRAILERLIGGRVLAAWRWLMPENGTVRPV